MNTEDFVKQVALDMLKGDKALLDIVSGLIERVAKMNNQIDDILELIQLMTNSLQLQQQTIDTQNQTIKLLKDHMLDETKTDEGKVH